MKLMSSKIYLRNVRFHAFHGVLPQEGIVGNDYLVNLVLDYDFSSAMKTDDLQGTLNYAEVYQKVREEMAVPSKLLGMWQAESPIGSFPISRKSRNSNSLSPR